MADTEAISRLIASSALAQGERELLRSRKPEAQSKAQTQPAGPAPLPPLANDQKAVSTVLLAMLDDKLDAAPTHDGAGRGPAGDPSNPAMDNRAAAQGRASAQYAAASAAFFSEPIERQPTPPPQLNVAPPILVPTALAAPELQTFIQRLMSQMTPNSASAARSQSASTGQDRPTEWAFQLAPVLFIAAVLAAAILWLI